MRLGSPYVDRVASADAVAPDRPWRRPGALRYALHRLHRIIRPTVRIDDVPTGALVIDNDVAVPMRDGTRLRVNVYRPGGDGPFPVLLCAHPYGKDKLPTGGRIPFPYRILRQPAPVQFSSLTTWESPDPAWWTAQGYAVVNCDLRGAGTSDGTGSLLSVQEGQDGHDLVEWAAAQPWSTGRVGMIGVSYLAMSQWSTAAQRPAHLRAIVPWEGMTDPYRDLLRPGGIQETGFVRMWARGLKGTRLTYDMGQKNIEHPLRDSFWDSVTPDLAAIDVPALVCGSLSDNNLHSRGSIRGFQQIRSRDKHLYTHRGGKWATFYSPQARATQLAFLNRHLRDGEDPELPPVRVEVRAGRDEIVDTRAEDAWPLSDTRWTPLHLGADGLTLQPSAVPGSAGFDTQRGGLRFGWTVPKDVELTGPMALRLFVSVAGADDVDLFVGVEKWRGSTYVPFEGSYGFGRDRVTTGWLKASLRDLDTAVSTAWDPVPTFSSPRPLQSGEVVGVDIALGPSSTLFRAGEQLRVVVAGRWLWPHNPLTGQLPARYAPGPRATCTLHWGAGRRPRLLVPVVSR